MSSDDVLSSVYILSVTPKQQRLRTLYVIVGSDGRKYATTDTWIASLCKRALELQRPVSLFSGAGWHYRELTGVQLVPPATV